MIKISDFAKQYNPTEMGEKVMNKMKDITSPEIKGAHVCRYFVKNDKAYIVHIANDQRPGEHCTWDFMYTKFMIMDLSTKEIIWETKFGSEHKFSNLTLPHGPVLEATIFELNESTIRVMFASEDPNARQAEYYYIDFDLKTQSFESEAHRLQIKTENGVEPITPKAILCQAERLGYKAGVELDHTIYPTDHVEINGEKYICFIYFSIRKNQIILRFI